MIVDEKRPGLFTVTVTAYELSTLIAGARVGLHLLDGEQNEALAAVLAGFEQAVRATSRCPSNA